MYTSGYQVSDLENVDFYWENVRLDVDAVYRPGTDKPFSPSTFNEFEICSLAGNPFLIDEQEDEENSPLPTTAVSERPTRTPALLRSRPLGRGIENVPD